MKKIVLCFIAPLLIAASLIAKLQAVELPNEEDRNAILQIAENWILGWQNCDSELAVEGFANNIDWINAFGVKRKGKAEVKEFLDWIFSHPNARERKNTGTINEIKFIKPDVALVYSDFQVENQRYRTGEMMPKRKGNVIRVMLKEMNEWQIISMMIMDEKSSTP